MSEWWKYDRAIEGDDDPVVPALTFWTGALTDAGMALAAWLEATGKSIPDVPAKKHDSTPLIVRFFDTQPEAAAALWLQYIASQPVVLHE